MNWDATHVYLPMAQQLLSRGLAFFSDPASVRMAPFTYVYPAIFAGDAEWVRHANVMLFAVIVILVAAAAWTAHSRRAGIAAAFLTALSPLLREWIGDAMSEPPFLALIAAWLLAVARLAAGGSRAWTPIAGFAFALASLTRPACSLLAPMLAVAFAWRALRDTQDADRSTDRRMAVAHALATLGWGVWLLHNAWRFGFPSIAAGGGTALWLPPAPPPPPPRPP